MLIRYQGLTITQWTLGLALTTELADDSRYDVLHALACTFFEPADADHDAADKPFAVRLAPPTPTGSALTLAWLPDTPPPVTAIPAALRLGPRTVPVTAFGSDLTPLADLGTGTSAGRVRYRAVSPTHLRHHGRDYPLPDPGGAPCRRRQVRPVATVV